MVIEINSVWHYIKTFCHKCTNYIILQNTKNYFFSSSSFLSISSSIDFNSPSFCLVLRFIAFDLEMRVTFPVDSGLFYDNTAIQLKKRASFTFSYKQLTPTFHFSYYDQKGSKRIFSHCDLVSPLYP